MASPCTAMCAGFFVAWKPHGIGSATPPATIAFTNASADITGLVPDSRYTFKVVATNRFGDSPESDGLRARTPDLEYSWGHQADHTAKYEKGTIGSSIIEDAIQDAAEDWNNEMVVLNKGLKICDDVDISCGGANTDGGIATIQAEASTSTNPVLHAMASRA